MLDKRAPLRSYNKRFGFPRDAVKLREFRESALFFQRQRIGPCSQKMAPLPSEKVSSSPAFTHVGIDFAGPLFVLGGPTSTEACICILVCASSRMTHLEPTIDLSTNEFFQTLIRMISRRGLRSTIWSDNAKMFKSADPKIQ